MLYTSDGSTRNFGFWIGSCTYLYDMFHNYTPGWKGVSEISVYLTFNTCIVGSLHRVRVWVEPVKTTIYSHIVTV